VSWELKGKVLAAHTYNQSHLYLTGMKPQEQGLGSEHSQWPEGKRKVVVEADNCNIAIVQHVVEINN